MTNTSIFDFVNEYNEKNFTRFHMPGHKGKGILGAEKFDITEIKGADSLYCASGIIEKSEKIASDIFETRKTFFSCEGSSQCIKAMLYCALVNSTNNSKTIVCARSSHQSFYNACALLDLTPKFIKQDEFNLLDNVPITKENLEETLNELNEKPIAVFITSPNYLGQIQDVKELSKICKKHNLPLLVDNAHGAYLRFTNQHPINLGADICCDSAHKTLPALTGAAYLHIANNAIENYEENAKKAMLLFGSTSPSYLILCSLDYCNKIMLEDYEKIILNCIKKIDDLKFKLREIGISVLKSEPFKIVLDANKIGYKGDEIAQILRVNKIECEYSDEKYLVLMVTSNNSDNDFAKLYNAFKNIKILPKIIIEEHEFSKPNFAINPRQAMLSKTMQIKTEDANGKICANIGISCPPAIPIVIAGEIIDEKMINILKHYGVNEIEIVCDNL